eukprot:2204412-Ditylum_brightwellii.AAC.1
MARINSLKVNDVLVKEILQANMEALFQLKDRFLARDREIMFQDRHEMELFLQKKWGIKLSVQQAIANVRLISQYFVRLATCTKPLLLKHHHTRFDRTDHDRHRQRVLSTITHWLSHT